MKINAQILRKKLPPQMPVDADYFSFSQCSRSNERLRNRKLPLKLTDFIIIKYAMEHDQYVATDCSYAMF